MNCIYVLSNKIVKDIMKHTSFFTVMVPLYAGIVKLALGVIFAMFALEPVEEEKLVSSIIRKKHLLLIQHLRWSTVN